MPALVVSDAHLSEGKGRGASRAIAELIEYAAKGGAGLDPARLEIVCAGDVLDLDPAFGRTSSPHQIIREILASHPELTHALRSAMYRGASVVFVAGNHDADLQMSESRRAIDEAIGFPGVHRTWFHQTHCGAHVEHGHLFDPACAGHAGQTLGSLGARHAHLAFPGLDPEGIDSLHPNAYLAHVKRLVGADPAHARRAVLAGASFLRSLAAVETMPLEHGAMMSQLASAAVHEHGGLVDVASVLRHAAATARACTPGEFAEARGWDGYKNVMEDALLTGQKRIQEIYRVPVVIFGHTHSVRLTRGAPTPLVPSGAALMNAGCWGEDGGTYAVHDPAGGRTGVYRWGHTNAEFVPLEARLDPRRVPPEAG